VPCEAAGAPPRVMKQPPPAAAVKCQRPAIAVGGGEGGGGDGGGAAAIGASGLGSDAQPASATTPRGAATAAAVPRHVLFWRIRKIGMRVNGPRIRVSWKERRIGGAVQGGSDGGDAPAWQSLVRDRG